MLLIIINKIQLKHELNNLLQNIVTILYNHIATWDRWWWIHEDVEEGNYGLFESNIPVSSSQCSFMFCMKSLILINSDMKLSWNCRQFIKLYILFVMYP
jgi:hypothetical protein